MQQHSRSRWLAGAGAFLAALRCAEAQGLPKIRMSAVLSDDMTPIFYAIQRGLYRDAGLDVEVIPTQSGAASTAAVVAGAYELGKSSPIASLVAHHRGLPLGVVANGAVWDPKHPYNLLVVAVDSPIKKAADCNGKIGSAPGLNDTTQLGVLQWVDDHGGDSKSMKWIEIPGSAAAAAIAEHRVDLTTLNEPYLSRALTEKSVRPLGDAYSSIGKRWAGSVYLGRPDWVKQNPGVAKQFVRVTYASAAYTNAHPNETVEMMSALTKIPPEVYRGMTRIEGCISSDPALLSPVIALASRYGAIPHDLAAKEMYL